ncbi:MAG: recombinase family protein [Bacilli bacterium]|nr:recombinase family protein [Bacilli bacterium]MDD4808474.1 recombinase family protein [Bacilli bacterium]
MKRVSIYARVSTEHEAQLSALENQIQYYDELLLKHPEWELYKRYIDEGITGTSTRKRPNFLRMIADAEKGCFDLIITREVSRFARNTVDALQETRNLKKLGVEVYFVDDNIWTSNDEDGELRLTIMATLAQNESKKTSMRVKAGQMISYKNGIFYGTGNILGYDRVGSEMVVNEKQAEIVKLIYKLYLEGIGTPKIKIELEKRGYLTATGLKKWNATSIFHVLRNPFYSGTIVYRKAYVPDYLEQKSVKNEGQVEQVIIEGRHVPIISKEDFQKVSKILEKKSKTIKEQTIQNGQMPSSAFVEKLVCDCGSTFNKRIYHTRGDGSKVYCYQCYTQKKYGSKRYRESKGLETTDSCNIPIIQEWKLKCIAFHIFEILWRDQNRIIKIANNLIDKSISEANTNYEETNKVNIYLNTIKNIKEKQDRLLELYINGLLAKEDFIKKKEELDNEKKETDILIKENEFEEPITKENVKEKIKMLKQVIKKSYRSFDDDITDEFLKEFVDYIKIKESHIEWYLNLFNDKIDLTKERTLLTRLALNKDDVGRYFSLHYKGSYNRVKELIYVNIYI